MGIDNAAHCKATSITGLGGFATAVHSAALAGAHLAAFEWGPL